MQRHVAGGRLLRDADFKAEIRQVGVIHEQSFGINRRRIGGRLLGIVGRRGTRFLRAFVKVGNGADEYSHVHGGRDFNFVVGAAEKFSAIARYAQPSPAFVA